MSGKKRKETEAVIAAEEGLRVDVQHHLSMRMVILGISNEELAKRLGVQVRSVRRMLDSSMNMRLKTIARVYQALGDEVRLLGRVKRTGPMSSMREFQDAAETTFNQTRNAVDGAAAKAALADFEEAIQLLSDAEHYLDMTRRHLRLASEAKAREASTVRR